MVTISGPRNARIDPESGLRYYTWRGREMRSVTSARSMAGMAFNLHRWYIRKICDRATLEHAEVGRMLARPKKARERNVEENRLEEARRFLRRAPEDERDYKALRGTAVHEAAERRLRPDEVTDYLEVRLRIQRRDDEGKPILTAGGKPSVETVTRRGYEPLAVELDGEEVGRLVIPADDIRPRLTQYLDWLSISNAEVLVAEGQVWNLTLGYAGSFDILCRFPNGELWIVDIKTGDESYSDYVLQQCAYLMAEFIGADDVIDEEATGLLHQVSGVAILHLHEDRWEFLRLVIDQRTWEAFRGLLAFATWTAAHPTEETFVSARREGKAAVDEAVQLAARTGIPVRRARQMLDEEAA